MANLTQTAANVAKNSGSETYATAGESITAGMPVYLKSSDSKIYQCDSNVTSAEAACVGIALCSAAASQPVVYAQSGATVDLGATLTVGETYVLSATKGAIAPVGDLATNDYVTHLGVASAADNLNLRIYASGIQHA